MVGISGIIKNNNGVMAHAHVSGGVLLVCTCIKVSCGHYKLFNGLVD